MAQDVRASDWGPSSKAPPGDLLFMIGRLPTRRCRTTVFCVNAKVLGLRIAPLLGSQVADSGFSHILGEGGARAAGHQPVYAPHNQPCLSPDKRQHAGMFVWSSSSHTRA